MNVRQKIKSLFDFRPYKIRYLIKQKEWVDGIWDTLINHCSVKYSKEVHDIMVNVVNDIIMDGNGVEVDWTEEEYKNFVVFRHDRFNK
jgi:hypothetical protein